LFDFFIFKNPELFVVDIDNGKVKASTESLLHGFPAKFVRSLKAQLKEIDFNSLGTQKMTRYTKKVN
jgi:hypothetical protein